LGLSSTQGIRRCDQGSARNQEAHGKHSFPTIDHTILEIAFCTLPISSCTINMRKILKYPSSLHHTPTSITATTKANGSQLKKKRENTKIIHYEKFFSENI